MAATAFDTGISTFCEAASSTSTGAVNSPSASLSRAACSPRPSAIAEREIARLRAGAGQDQVAQARKSRQGFAARAAGAAEPQQFGEAARGQGRLRRGAQFAADHDAGGDRQHVFGGAADLDAANIGGCDMAGTSASPAPEPARSRVPHRAPPASPRSAGRARHRRQSSAPTGSRHRVPARPPRSLRS